ncbi:MAG TPA: serine/threonine-protein kinase [Thermoguttaceae bacterium]|nr:serine/threonine-protein kinase [Thermoguttaceae bacterium]
MADSGNPPETVDWGGTGPGTPGPGDCPKVQPERIGRYRVVKTLGAGAFGRVYLARDDELNRPVAIKVPHRHRVATPEDRDRYLAEARVVASLDHEGIVPVYDVGRSDDGVCYVVSKLISGRNLAAVIARARPSHVESAAMVAAVADALHYAHTHNVLAHRDVKPANILVDAAGKPYLTDFGLALKEIEFGRGRHCTGTPAYMSPEQARSEGHLVDSRSDVFSLGVVFYELLTGKRPFRASDKYELLEQVKTLEPRPPRQLGDTIPKELERICLKTLSKRASDRYTTASDMAEDLRQWTSEHRRISADVVPRPVEAPSPADRPVRVVPKGLRSFDKNDADFFLGLLPGPFDRDGLPESIRFWKTAIETMDPDETFRVGVIYGPSGCGKSSLVKAGLLPRLGENVVHVYVEATPEGTERQLLRRLQKAFPDLADSRNLIECLSQLRRGHGIPWDTKVLVVVDQFEQWLHARHDYGGSELAQALRHCDAPRVQCILVVPDEFWMALTRFMHELEVPLREGKNSAPVDLFDVPHAGQVLAEFGRAYGCLPHNLGETTPDQSEFLHHAVEEVAEDGRVIAVRISLLAEMVKGKPWQPSTLQELGGEEGIRLKFLEDTFSGPHAPPEHKLHEGAIRRVFYSLLPDAEHGLKGTVRSRDELLQASGYVAREGAFEEVLRILNGLHLITPADPEGAACTESDSSDPTLPAEKHYQLTHDYLVPSLREWLERKRRETRRGRAELLLEERTQQWSRSKDKRLLPSLPECMRIAIHTRWARWTARQRAMLRRASVVHTWRAAIGAVGIALIAALTLGIWNAYFRPPEQSELLETFASPEASQEDRIAAFDALDLDNSFVFLSTLEAVRHTADSVVTHHALSRLSHLACAAPESQNAEMLRAARQQVIGLLRDLLDEGDEQVDAHVFQCYCDLAPPPQVMEAIRECADREGTELLASMRQHLDELTLTGLSDQDRWEVLGTLVAMISEAADDKQWVPACVARIDEMEPRELITDLRKAYRSDHNIAEVVKKGVAPYLQEVRLERRDAIGAYAESRLVALVPRAGDVVYSRELEFLIVTLQHIAEHGSTRYDEAFKAVNRILEDHEMLDDPSLLSPTLRAFVSLRPQQSQVSLQPIRDILDDDFQDPPVRLAAAAALGDLHDKESIPLLREYAEDPTSFLVLRVAATESLTEIGSSLRQDGSSLAELKEILATLRGLLDARKKQPREVPQDVVSAVVEGYGALGARHDVGDLLPLLSEMKHSIGAIKAILRILTREPDGAHVVVRSYLQWRIDTPPHRAVDTTDSAITGFYSYFVKKDSSAGDIHALELAAKSVLETLAHATAEDESEAVRDHATKLVDELLDAPDAPAIDETADRQTRETSVQRWLAWWGNEKEKFRLTGSGLRRVDEGP